MYPLPIYIITLQDGIPIPNTRYLLDIPYENQQLFSTYFNEDREEFVLGFQHQTGTELSPIGVVCTTVSGKTISDTLVLECQIEQRVFVESMETKNTEFSIATVVPVCEALSKEEENAVLNFLKLVEKIDSPVFEDINDLLETDSLNNVVKLNAIADILLSKEEDRYEYVQTIPIIQQLQMVFQKLKNLIESKKQKPPPVPTQIVKTKSLTLEEQIKMLDIPESTRQELNRDIDKLNSLPDNSLEYSQVQDYLKWITQLPWGIYSNQRADLNNLNEILNKSHYGLPEVKRHILEHVCISNIKNEATGTVMCLVGPPGTGKTTMAKAIAQAMNRKVFKIALGGLGDSNELRGIRRSYVAARPGRIITGFKQAKTCDPVIILDEIDKLVANHHGDPAAVLLEILDPEQNNEFVDRYLEVPYDISKALFICTANYEEQIPAALKDRLEIIYLRNYSYEERLIIVKDYIIPNAVAEYGLELFPLKFTSEAIELLAGSEQIRSIIKTVKKVLRAAAADLELGTAFSIDITPSYIEKQFIQKKKTQTIGF